MPGVRTLKTSSRDLNLFMEIHVQGNLGKVTILTDRVIALGAIAGSFTLQPEKNRDGTARVIEIEMSWSP